MSDESSSQPKTKDNDWKYLTAPVLIYFGALAAVFSSLHGYGWGTALIMIVLGFVVGFLAMLSQV